MGRHIRQTASLRGGDAPELTAGGGDPRTSDRNGRAASTPGGPGEAHGRIVSLDGLRGVAALSVVCFHASGGTAIHDFVPGIPSVMVFFVLSGVVLSIVPLADPGYSWLRYFPRRVLRLGVPTAVATLLSVLVAVVVANTVGRASGIYADFRLAPAEPGNLTHWLYMAIAQFDFIFNASDGVTTVGGTPSNRIDRPVWSMTWEFFFSLILPLVIVIAARITRARTDRLVCAIVTACIFVSFLSGYFPLRFVVVFLFGVVIAKRISVIRAKRRGVVTVTLLTAAALALIELPTLLARFGGAFGQRPAVVAAGNTLMYLGGAMLVLAAAMPGWLASFLSWRPVDFLGRISFSLYLTHFLCVSAARMVAGRLGMGFSALPMALSVIASIVFAVVFYYAVEKPSIRLAKQAGALLGR